jgi:hypothetical protein
MIIPLQGGQNSAYRENPLFLLLATSSILTANANQPSAQLIFT